MPDPKPTIASNREFLQEQLAAPELIDAEVIEEGSDRRPEVASEKFHSLDPNWVTTERIGGWIFTSVLLVAGLIGLSIVMFSFGLLQIVSVSCSIAFLLIAAGLVWLTHVMPQKEFNHASWCLTDSGLEIRRGVWWRSQISVPLARVQHTDVHQGPLQRRFGLAKLTVHTAGTENSAVELTGLNFATAQRLRDALIENRGGIDGV